MKLHYRGKYNLDERPCDPGIILFMTIECSQSVHSIVLRICCSRLRKYV